MVEMRWLERPSPIQQPNSKLVYMDKVLQYRQRIFVGAWVGMTEPQPNGWSEWIDVPTVMGGS